MITPLCSSALLLPWQNPYLEGNSLWTLANWSSAVLSEVPFYCYSLCISHVIKTDGQAGQPPFLWLLVSQEYNLSDPSHVALGCRPIERVSLCILSGTLYSLSVRRLKWSSAPAVCLCHGLVWFSVCGLDLGLTAKLSRLNRQEALEFGSPGLLGCGGNRHAVSHRQWERRILTDESLTKQTVTVTINCHEQCSDSDIELSVGRLLGVVILANT